MSEQPRSTLHSITSGASGRAQIASAVALALAILAGGNSPAEAAGLGRLTVQSALGQPLRAEVEVTSVRPDEAASLSAKLASPDAFSRAGLQYKEALSAVQMAVEERNGRYVVKLSSNRPINEPFVDLMVELSWAAGKFVREYTFLLDPPVQRNANQQTSRSSNTPVVGAAASAAATGSAAVAQGSGSGSGVRTIDPVTGRLIDPSAPGNGSPGRTQGGGAGAGGGAPARSVVVGEGETLGMIAARVRPASATLEQTIVAIYRSNPSAFIQNNPHLIRQGRTLQIPSEGDITSVDRTEAGRQLRVAARDFRSYKERLAAVPVGVGAGGGSTTASGSIAARVDDQGARGTNVDRLELSRSNEESERSASAVGARDSEAVVAREAALKEANSRIAELERNVSDLQRMLELKNKSLADLQKQLEEARASGASVSGTVGAAAVEDQAARAEADRKAAEKAAADKAAAEKAAAEAKAVADRLAAEKAAAEKAAAEKAAADKAAAEKAAAEKAAAEKASADKAAADKAATEKAAADTSGEAGGQSAAEKAAEQARAEVEKVTSDKQSEPAGSPAPAARPAETPAEEEQPVNLFEGLSQSPMLLPVLGVFAVVAGLGYVVLRRRRRDEDGFGESIGADEFTANSLFGTTGGQSVDTMTGGTTQITTISESTPTEVDPIAEAEVYIAYGRETQAEEILREALKRQPERQAIRLKLLEIFSGRKDTVAFSQMAREMHDMTGGMNEEWARVAAMGAALDPDNALYSDGSQSGASVGSSVDNFAMGAAGVAAGVAGAVAAGQENVEAPAEQPAAAVQESVQEAAEDDSLAFEPGLDDSLADLDAEASRTADASEQPFPATRSGPLAAMPSVELPSLDLDAPLDLGESPSTVTDLHADTTITDSLDLPKDLGASADDVDLNSIGLDLSPSTISGPITMSGAASSQWQEMASKLDLASAYSEIGDKEGARELLEEVLTGGDAVQQQRARDMLADL